MDARKLNTSRNLFIVLCLSFTLTFTLTFPAQAQTSLALLTPVTGNVTAGVTNAWTFSAQNGAVLSFVVEAQSKDFDPVMTLIDSSGHEVISSDDYNYPTSLNPLLEAITLPRTDTYTLNVSGFKDTTGSYTLTMLPGYGDSAYSDDFRSSKWRALDSVVTAQQSSGQLQLSTQGEHQFGSAFDTAPHNVADFYAQAQVANVNDPSGWIVGMAMRRQGDSYYLLSINSQGSWRFSLIQNNNERVIRDWTPHPNIVAGANSFSIGVLAKGTGFDFFYNTGYIGSATDDALTGVGQIGLMLGSNSSLSSLSNALFSSLVVTTPIQVNHADVIPQEVVAGDGNQMVLRLRRNHVVSADGQMALTLADSSVQYAKPGINRVMLGRGVQYTNFALGATVDLSAAAPSSPAGCGVVFRLTGDTDYTLAYLDQTGEYGVSQRSGDTFSPGIYGKNPSIGAGQHLILLIANDNTIYYYIDRQLVGTQSNTAQAGQIGIAVVNFEPNTTTCHYTNLWLWNWS